MRRRQAAAVRRASVGLGVPDPIYCLLPYRYRLSVHSLFQAACIYVQSGRGLCKQFADLLKQSCHNITGRIRHSTLVAYMDLYVYCPLVVWLCNDRSRFMNNNRRIPSMMCMLPNNGCLPAWPPQCLPHQVQLAPHEHTAMCLQSMHCRGAIKGQRRSFNRTGILTPGCKMLRNAFRLLTRDNLLQINTILSQYCIL